MNNIKNWIVDLTELAVGIIALGVVAGVVFGNIPFVGAILSNFIQTVYSVGDGAVGAITLAIIVYFYSKVTE